MKLYERMTTSVVKELDDGTRQKLTTGIYIVFGEEDNFEERFYYTASLEDLGYSEEDALNLQFTPPIFREESLDIEKLKPQAGRIKLKDVYPEFDPDAFTVPSFSKEDQPSGVYLKQHHLIVKDGEDLLMQKSMNGDLLTEIKACEAMKEYPCPYVAKYLGCYVQNNLVTGIYYERYRVHLVHVPTPLNVEKYIENIRNGIEHIHSFGFCHNDISPYNIMINDDDTAVIIDFDACRPVGEDICKQAPEGFFRDTDVSEMENDWFGLMKTEEWMREKNEEEAEGESSSDTG